VYNLTSSSTLAVHTADSATKRLTECFFLVSTRALNQYPFKAKVMGSAPGVVGLLRMTCHQDELDLYWAKAIGECRDENRS
jgi:hypothetical protein